MMKKCIESIIVVSLDQPFEYGEDGPLCLADILRSNEDIEYKIELRDLIDRLPIDIVRLGQKKVDGYPWTPAERKQLERFRRRHRNNGNNGYKNKF